MNIEHRLQSKLKEIASVLEAESEENKYVGVLSGISGIALFQFYYSRYLGDDKYADQGVQNLTRMVDLINSGVVFPTFCTGIAGACWVMELLKEEEFVDLEDGFFSSDIDSFLLDAMHADLQKEYYDFLHGAIGYGYYFLKRFVNASTPDDKKRYKEYLDKLISSLKASAKKDNHGIWWQSWLSQEKEEEKRCNLSLSHGVSSIINFLARLAEQPTFYNEVQEILKHAVAYVLANKNKDVALSATFPNWVTIDNPNDEYSRLAWCYGDLGVGISLLRAGEVLKDTKLYRDAIHILKRTTLRRDVKEANVVDAGLCHGTYGILNIYNFIYKRTGDIVFKDAMDFWVEQSLAMDVHTNGYAGYKVWTGKDMQWVNEEALLEGIAGIGLSIISYLASFDTKWDECLLIG